MIIVITKGTTISTYEVAGFGLELNPLQAYVALGVGEDKEIIKLGPGDSVVMIDGPSWTVPEVSFLQKNPIKVGDHISTCINFDHPMLEEHWVTSVEEDKVHTENGWVGWSQITHINGNPVQ